MTTRKFPLSYSKLNTFDICPLQMEKVYVTKEVKDEGNEYSHYGERVHASLAEYGQTRNTHALTEETMRWKGLVDRVCSDPGEKYWELEMAVDQQLAPCSWFAPDTFFRAKADVLIVLGNKAKLFDWKTGAKVKPDALQMQIFASMVFLLYKEVEEVSTALVFLRCNKIVPQTFSRANFSLLWKQLEFKFNAVQYAVDSGVFPAKPRKPFPCNWCPAKDVCEFNK